MYVTHTSSGSSENKQKSYWQASLICTLSEGCWKISRILINNKSDQVEKHVHFVKEIT